MYARIVLPALLICALGAASSAQPHLAIIPAFKDNTLFESAFGNLSNGAGIGLYSGRTGQPTNNLRRALIAFDVAGSVPPGSTILTAELRLQLDQSTTSNDPYSLHVVTSDWGEGTSDSGVGPGLGGGGGGGAFATPGDATWLHTFFNTATWTTAGGDFNPTASATTNVSLPLGRKTWSSAQMVSDVQSWLDSGNNFGWLLKNPETVGSGAKRFNSREHPDVATRPILIVTYTPGTGAFVSSNGYGCGSPAFDLSTSAPPVIGTTFNALLTNGHPNGLGEVYLSSGLSSNYVPFPGQQCAIWVDIPSTLAQIAAGTTPLGPFPLDGAGGFSFTAGLPNVPALIGLTVTAQATSVDTATGALLTSNALFLIIG